MSTLTSAIRSHELETHWMTFTLLLAMTLLICFWVCIPFPKQALVFTCLQKKSLENAAEKGEIARYEQFLLFPQCFLPVLRTFCHFHQT